MINTIIIDGRLTRDPELKYVGDKNVVNFDIAWNGYNDRPQYIGCQAWGKTAELINTHLSKGSPLTIEGRLAFESWDDQSGNKRSKNIIVAERVTFRGKKPESDHSDD